MSPELGEIEREIDEAFEASPLTGIPFAQAVWSVLSVAEDLHLFRIASGRLDDQAAATFADGLVNALTYPLRACQKKCDHTSGAELQRRLVDDHYQWAIDWLDAAEDYAQFCTVFPLAHAGELVLEIQGDELIPRGWAVDDFRYESYDRLVAKREDHPLVAGSATALAGELHRCMTMGGNFFSVKFSKRLMTVLQQTLGAEYEQRHDLPSGWSFSQFALAEFRSVIVCLQSLAHCWFLARQMAANAKAPAAAFSSAVWTPRKTELVALIWRSTAIDRAVIARVLQYLTFGQMAIRSPDIAIQPLIDLENGQYAISPFVLMHLNAERNLCVLLNQVPADRKIYSRLVNEKEHQARDQIRDSLTELGLRFEYGDVTGTDIDLAIIDDANRVCLCVEIKWFIEPAEVREILDRSKEILKGVKQALRVKKLFSNRDPRLLALLRIDSDYDFECIVGSSNFIGAHRTQHPDVAVIKLWHLWATIRSRGLSRTLDWLRKRQYLPLKDLDYVVLEHKIRSGKWSTNWYGIQHLREFPNAAELAS